MLEAHAVDLLSYLHQQCDTASLQQQMLEHYQYILTLTPEKKDAYLVPFKQALNKTQFKEFEKLVDLAIEGYTPEVSSLLNDRVDDSTFTQQEVQAIAKPLTRQATQEYITTHSTRRYTERVENSNQVNNGNGYSRAM